MSDQNVAVVRSIVDAWNRGDYAAAVEPIAPDVRVESALEGDLGGTYEGVEALQDWLAHFWSAFVEFRSEIEQYIPVGDDVVIDVHHYGRGRASGVEVEMRNWQVLTVRGGKVVRYRVFNTRQEALAAASGDAAG